MKNFIFVLIRYAFSGILMIHPADLGVYASYPFGTGGCTSSRIYAATSKKRRMDVMQLFSIIMESRRVRSARAACPFYAIFRTHPLPLSPKERVDRLGSVLARPRNHRAVSFPLNVIQRNAVRYSIPLSPPRHYYAFTYFSFIRRPFKIQRKFPGSGAKPVRSFFLLLSFFFFFHSSRYVQLAWSKHGGCDWIGWKIYTIQSVKCKK